MNEALKRRLAGALLLIAAALLLSVVLPSPGPVADTDGDVRSVTIDLRATPVSEIPVTPTPVPPVIAAPQKIAAADAAAPDNDDATLTIDQPVENDIQPESSVPSVAPAAEALPKPELKSESSTSAADSAAPPQHAPPADGPATATTPVPPKLKLEPALKPPPTPTGKTSPPAAPAAEKPAAGAKQWYVQAGAFSEISNAHQVLKALVSGGLKGIISPADAHSGTQYRVRVGPFATREQAQAAQRRAVELGYKGAALAQE